jgi:hypothetical protein
MIRLLTLCFLLTRVTAAQYPSPAHQRLDEAAAALDASNPRTVSDVVKSALSIGHHLSVPDLVSTWLTPRVEAAETAYWIGVQKGVKESDIVGAVNDLADTLKLPQYAKTSASQIHHLRVKSLLNPRFMGARIATRDQQGRGFHLSDSMSPLQALHLTLTLIDVKFLMPEYQFSPAEWEANHDNIESASSHGPANVRSSDTVRGMELTQSVADGVSGLSDAEGLAMLAKLMRNFGIDKKPSKGEQ